jgi:hypothetical protein
LPARAWACKQQQQQQQQQQPPPYNKQAEEEEEEEEEEARWKSVRGVSRETTAHMLSKSVQ